MARGACNINTCTMLGAFFTFKMAPVIGHIHNAPKYFQGYKHNQIAAEIHHKPSQGKFHGVRK